MNDNKWSTEWPTEVGLYWFYGELYRPLSCRPKPELELVSARKISNGYMYVANGQFVGQEGMQGLWQKAQLPELPKTNWKYKWKEKFYWCNNPECNHYRQDWFMEWKEKLNEKEFGHKSTCHFCYRELELVVDDLSIFPE